MNYNVSHVFVYIQNYTIFVPDMNEKQKKTSNMKHEPETKVGFGIAVIILIIAFGMLCQILNSDEIAKREQQRLDNIIKTYKLH